MKFDTLQNSKRSLFAILSLLSSQQYTLDTSDVKGKFPLEYIKKIQEICGIKPEVFDEENVIKITIPLTDIKVSIDNWPLDPFMGIATWIGFQQGIKKDVDIMAMGDLVLLADQVNTVMSIALDHDVKITALHNHFASENPQIYFMHIEIEGKFDPVVQAIAQMLNAQKNYIKEVKKDYQFTKNDIDAQPLENILGIKGISKNGMFKIVVGRKIFASCGCPITKNMGVNSWATWSGTDKQAIVDGDCIVLENELQLLLKTLRNNDINVVAIHNHMTHEKPRVLFVHFWGQDTAENLAQKMKKVLAVNKEPIKN